MRYVYASLTYVEDYRGWYIVLRTGKAYWNPDRNRLIEQALGGLPRHGTQAMQTLAHVALIGSVVLLSTGRGRWIPGLIVAICYIEYFFSTAE